MREDVVVKELIRLDLDVDSSKELFQVMSKQLIRLGYVTGEFLESINAREEKYPTALPIEPYAVAIPHTDPDCIITPFISCIRIKHSVPWREMAANEIVRMVRFVFLLGFKEEDVGDAHVELLQILVNNCQDPAFMERLMKAEDTETYYKAIISMKGMG